MAKFIRYQALHPFLEPTKETIDAIENYIRWAEQDVPHLMPIFMAQLVYHMALLNQGYAREMSFGPYDPTGRNSSLAWRTPSQGIRRISQRYYLGWKVKQIGPGAFKLYNDSREAYFIEFGISEVGWGAGRHVPARRIRRPVLKLSLKKTLEKMMTTQAYHRVWASIYANPRSHRSKGFTQIVQGPAKGGFTGPMLGRRLPP